MKIAAKSKLIMIGDSVTDCARAQPFGEGLFEGIGKSYVGYVDALLGTSYPERAIRVINMGISGNTVRDLKARWQHDVIEQRPDWLSIMIGINDVWRQFDSPRQAEQHVLLEEYAQTLEELIVQTKPLVAGLVLMTPYYMEPNRNDAMRAQMDRYGEAVRDLASKHGTLFVDLQAEFDILLASCHSASIAWDRIHPNHIGHMLIARAFLRAVDFAW